LTPVSAVYRGPKKKEGKLRK